MKYLLIAFQCFLLLQSLFAPVLQMLIVSCLSSPKDLRIACQGMFMHLPKSCLLQNNYFSISAMLSLCFQFGCWHVSILISESLPVRQSYQCLMSDMRLWCVKILPHIVSKDGYLIPVFSMSIMLKDWKSPMTSTWLFSQALRQDRMIRKNIVRIRSSIQVFMNKRWRDAAL